MASGTSTSHMEDCHQDTLQVVAPSSPISTDSQVSSSAEADLHDFDLSEDEGRPPDQPVFTGLFPQALFKSLLFKVVNTSELGLPSPTQAPSLQLMGLWILFSLNHLRWWIPFLPHLFLDVIRKQWISPGAAPTLSAMDKKKFNVASELASLLQVPSTDSSIAALLPNAAILGNLDEGL